jgi:hypothetical protein
MQTIDTPHTQSTRLLREEEARTLLQSDQDELVRRYAMVCSLYEDDLADRSILEEEDQQLREAHAEDFEENAILRRLIIEKGLASAQEIETLIEVYHNTPTTRETELERELASKNIYITELEEKLTATTVAAIGMIHQIAEPSACTHCEQLEKRYGCSINDLLDTTAKMVPLAAYLKVQQERDHWREQAEGQTTIAGLTLTDLQILWRTKQLNTTQKLALPYFVEAIQNAHGQPQDQQGRRRINCGTIASQIGADASTVSRLAQFCKTQLPHLFDIESHSEHVPGVKKPVDRIYARVKEPTFLKHPNDLKPLQPRNQGGDRYTGLRCNKCESERYEIEERRKTTHIFRCLDCKHEIVLDESETKSVVHSTASETPITNKKQLAFYSNEQDSEKILTSEPCNLHPVITSEGGQDATRAEHLPDDNQMAAQLLLECAGMDQAHILMMEEGEDKYKFRDGPLTLEMVQAHLEGEHTYGASLEYPDGTTRMTLRDADSVADIAILCNAALRLADAGYSPLLEYSPVKARDGEGVRRVHLILIYSDRVNAEAALRREQEIVPELEQIREYWPNPRAHQRVRLPGGRYVRPGYGQWCELFGVEGEGATGGAAAARLLLESLTPASLVPAASVIIESGTPTVLAPDPQVDHQGEPSSSEDVHQDDSRASVVVGQHQTDQGERAGGLQDDQGECERRVLEGDELTRWCLERAGLVGDVRLPVVDEYWVRNNGPVELTTYYFAVMPGYAAGEYNSEHPLDKIHPREKRNGMAMSPNGQERTASTSYRMTAQGERYTDHSQHGRRPDGTRDTGDALELASKVKNTSKPELLSMTTGQIVAKARAELEAAARAGQPIPAWLEFPICIVTPAGRRRYLELLAECAQRPVDHSQTEEQVQAPVVQDTESQEDVTQSMESSIPAYEPLPEISEELEQASQRYDVARELLEELAGYGLELQCRADGLHNLKRVAEAATAPDEAKRRWKRTVKQYGSELVDILGITERLAEELPAPPCVPDQAPHKIGACANCGSTKWYPHPEVEYFCAKCYESIAYTRAVEARKVNPFS